MVLGFAEGFRSGYGMVEDTIERRQRRRDRREDIERLDRIREEERTQRRMEREEDLVRSAMERQQDIDFRQEQLQVERDRIGFDQGLKLAQQINQNNKSDIEIQEAKLRIGLVEEEQKRKKEEEDIAKGGLALTNLINRGLPKGLGEGGELTDEQASEINGLLALAVASPLDPTPALDLFAEDAIKNAQDSLSAFARGEQGDNEAILGAINNLLVFNNKKLVGKTVTLDEFPNAPPKFANGDFEVLGTEVSDIDGRMDENGNPVIDTTVFVSLENKRTGETTGYFTEMTEGRQPTGVQYSLPVNEMTKAFGQKLIYLDYIKNNRESLLEQIEFATFRKDGKYDRKAYEDRLAEQDKRFQEELEYKVDMPVVQGSRLTFGDVAKDPKLRDEYVRQKTLLGVDPTHDLAKEMKTLFEEVRSLPQIQKFEQRLNRLRKPLLNNKDLSELVSLLDYDESGDKIILKQENKDEYKDLLRRKLQSGRQSVALGQFIPPSR